MKKTILAMALLFGICSLAPADIVEKGSKTDAAVANVLDKGSAALNKIVNESIDVLKSGKDFVVSEAPKVIREYLNWKLAVSIYGIVVGFLLLGFGQYFFRKRTDYKYERYDISRRDVYIWLGAIGSIIGPIFILIDSYQIIYILCAPRIYLIQHLVELVKTGQM